jgi:Methionine aminopeptidase
MITRKSKEEIKRMRHAGHIVALVHQEMKRIIEPGINTKYLDNVAFDIIKKTGLSRHF